MLSCRGFLSTCHSPSNPRCFLSDPSTTRSIYSHHTKGGAQEEYGDEPCHSSLYDGDRFLSTAPRIHTPFESVGKGDESTSRPGWRPVPIPFRTRVRSKAWTVGRKEGAPFHPTTDEREPNAMALANDEAAKAGSNRIQVSNTKKPLFFYVNLSKVRASRSERKRNVDPIDYETTTVDRTDPTTAWSCATTSSNRAQVCRHRERRYDDSMCMQEDRIDGGSNDGRWTWRKVLTWPCGHA